MRVSAAILSAIVAPCTALSLWSDDARRGVSPNEDLKIPGESPLKHCAGKKTDGYIEINSIDLTPNPPSAYVLFPLHGRLTHSDWALLSAFVLKT